MQPTTVELRRDILREAEFLSAHATQTTCESFLQDEVLKRAFVRSAEIIGEATKKVPEETRLRFPALCAPPHLARRARYTSCADRSQRSS